ncbi:hypothetical protein [Streptomyces sp. NPDC005281]|uniref:hypothetical protein n=1 Tax=Streptomyces sp. NPDC005281 TaxID=3155712 RepID=UPI0033ADE617
MRQLCRQADGALGADPEHQHQSSGHCSAEAGETQIYAVLAWQPARGYGGTADVVSYAQLVGVPVTVLWPHGASR